MIKTFFAYTTTKFMIASALFKVGGGLAIMGTGGDVPWDWTFAMIGSDFCFSLGRALIGEKLAPPKP